MKEQLMGGGLTLLPNGPGPQELIAYYQDPEDTSKIAGFYGEVTTNELISGTALASKVNLTAGTEFNANEPWLKFRLDNKTLFIPKKPYRYNFKWDDLKARSLTNMNLIVTISGYNFIIRLMLGSDTNPPPSALQVNGANYNDPVGSRNSEWSRLFYPLTNEINPASQQGPNWANYTMTELGLSPNAGNGVITLCYDRWGSDRYVSRGGRSIISAEGLLTHYTGGNGTYYVATTYGWRPVLELIP